MSIVVAGMMSCSVDVRSPSAGCVPDTDPTPNAQRGMREFLGALPFDSLPVLGNLLETGRIKFVDLYGNMPSRGHADIRSIHFLKKYDPEEY